MYVLIKKVLQTKLLSLTFTHLRRLIWTKNIVLKQNYVYTPRKGTYCANILDIVLKNERMKKLYAIAELDSYWIWAENALGFITPPQPLTDEHVAVFV